MKIGLVSLGCPKNLVDSEVMLGLAQNAGHELTPDPANADVLVVNTCAKRFPIRACCIGSTRESP